MGGIYTTDTTWTAAAGPYYVDAPIQIAPGTTLRIEAGTRVVSRDFPSDPYTGTFGVGGTLEVMGTAQAPVIIDGGTNTGLAQGLANSPGVGHIRVQHADISNFDSIAAATGQAVSVNHEITDSRISNITSFSYFWYPPDYVRLERNLFVDVAALTFGTNVNAVATVTHNRFRGSNGYESYRHQLESWAAYGAPMQVHDNVFESSSSQTYAIKVVSDGRLDAASNYWGTTDLATVKSRIRDKEDDLNLPDVVPVEPLLESPASGTATAVALPPPAPTATGGDTAASVSWSPPAENGGSPITAYTVTSTPGGHTVTVPGSHTAGTVTGLTNGTAYTFSVRATNAVGASPASAPSATVTPAGVPAGPTGVTGTRGDQSVQLSWTAPAASGSPITGYTITSSPDGLTTTVPGDQTNGAVTGLTNGTAYTFTVTATNSVGTSPSSASSAAVTPATVPGRVAKPTVKVDGRKAIIKWNLPSDGGSPLTGYRVTVNGKVRTIGADVRKLVLKKLRPGRYKVKVAAVNAVGAGVASDIAKFRIRAA